MSKKKIFRCVNVILSAALVMLPVRGYSLPEGESVVSGSATFDRSADTLTINQISDNLIANYNSFSIAQTEAVNFNQPTAQSIALNRVVGVDPSAILGTLTANGRVFLINPNGILFGQGCRVDTAGMVASTLDISDSDFLAGRYSFVDAGGSVVNQGYISSPGGYVALLGSSVENTGIIEANLGSVALASGNAVTLNLDPLGLVSVVIDESTLANPEAKDAAVNNSGTLKASGGKVLLTAKTLSGIFNRAINTDGIIEANSWNNQNGAIIIDSNQRVNVAGAIESGTISIISGEDIRFGDNSVVTANGPITLLADKNIIQGFNSVITGTRLASFVTDSLESSVNPNQWYNHPEVDFTWEYFFDPATTLPAFTATATNGNYAMYAGSSVRTNGGNIEINAEQGWLHINSGSTYRGFLNAGAGEIYLYLGKNLVVNDLSSPTFRAGDGGAGVFVTVDNNPSKNVKAAAFADGSSDPVQLAFDASFKLGDIDGILGPVTVIEKTGDTTGVCGVSAAASQEGAAWVFTVSDVNGGVGSLSNFMFDWTAPVITSGTPSGIAGLNGWYTGDVTVPFSATDNLSGFGETGVLSLDLASQTTSGEGIDLIVTSEGVYDLAGNFAAGIIAGPFKVDMTAPVITAGTPTGITGNDDWWISDVTVPFSATDNLSGFDADGTLSADLASQSTAGDGLALFVTSDGVYDYAGNFASGISAGPFKVDQTAPVIAAGTPTGTAGNDDWWLSDVTVPFSATDNLSGFAPSGDLYVDLASQTTSGEGIDLIVTSEGVYDLAGNFAAGIDAGPFKVDQTAPVIAAGTPGGTPGDGSTWVSDVTVPFSATDNLSGFASDGALNTDMASKTTNGEGTGLIVTSDGIYDLAGNFAAGIIAGPFTVAYPRAASMEAPFVDDGSKYFRAYYEILDVYRFVSNEPATPTSFYAYHPLVPIDAKVFAEIEIDAGAYDFINDNVKLKGPLAPYFDEDESLRKKKKS